MAERIITCHVRQPVPVAMKARSRHIGIVIPWHHAHVRRPPQGFEPTARMGELGLECDVDEIACHGEMVRLRSVNVARDGVESIAAMGAMAAAPPIDVADQAFRREFPHARPRERPEMRVGQMCEHEWFTHSALSTATSHGTIPRGRSAFMPYSYPPSGYELPMRMPAAKTSTPPTTTWNAAARNGVSM